MHLRNLIASATVLFTVIFWISPINGQTLSISATQPPTANHLKKLKEFRLSKAMSFSFDAKIEHAGRDNNGKIKWIEGMAFAVKASRPSKVRMDDITPIRRLKPGEEILLSNRNFLRANGSKTLEGHTRLKKYEVREGSPRIDDLRLPIVQEVHGDLIFVKEFEKEFDFYFDSQLLEEGVKVSRYVYNFGTEATGKGRAMLSIDVATNLPHREVDLEQDSKGRWVETDRVTYSNWLLNPTLPDLLFDPTPPSEFEGISPELPNHDQTIVVGGKPFPIDTIDVNGNHFSLKNHEGKVILLDFWATWCSPCMSELVNLKEFLNKYDKQRFQIVSISLDETPDLPNLHDVIKADKLTWTQLCDGKGFKSPFAIQYKLNAIPFNILIGKDGKIIAVDKHGNELEDEIMKALKK